MNTLQLLGLVLGLALRLLLPLTVTLAVALVLKRLDDRWRDESLAASALAAGSVGLQQCWDVMHCPPERRAGCKAFNAEAEPCWEIVRSGGQLQEACRDCPLRRSRLAAAAA